MIMWFRGFRVMFSPMALKPTASRSGLSGNASTDTVEKKKNTV